MTEFIAERELVGIKPDGEKVSIFIRIGKPYDSGKDDWTCPVELKGLYDKLGPIFAVDSFHALMLAILFVKKLLGSFVEDGGQLFWVDTKDSVDMEELFSIGVGTKN